MDIIKKRTRRLFQEYLVTVTLREIETYFDNHDIEFIPLQKTFSLQVKEGL